MLMLHGQSSTSTLLYIVGAEAESQSFAGGHLRVADLFHHLVDRGHFNLFIGGHQEVELDGVLDGCFHDFAQDAGRNGVDGEILHLFAGLPFSFHEKMFVLVDENAGDHVPQVIDTVVFEGVGQEVIDHDHSAIAAQWIILDILHFTDRMFVVKFKDIGVHTEEQQVFTHPEVHFKGTFFLVTWKGAVGNFSFQYADIVLFELFQHFFEDEERLGSIMENLLFDCRFDDIGLHQGLAVFFIGHSGNFND